MRLALTSLFAAFVAVAPGLARGAQVAAGHPALLKTVSMVDHLPMAAPAVDTPVPAPTAPAAPREPALSTRSIVIGLGAVAGVVAFNAIALGPGAFPGGLAYAAGATVPAEMAVAINRIYAVGSGVAGGWFGEYYYALHAQEPTLSGRLASAGAGAVVGVVAFGLLAGPYGPVPFAGGAGLEALPSPTMVGSRLIAVTTAGLGALAATWMHDDYTGEHVDPAYALSLFGGALLGVAAGNLLFAGELGVPPYYVGAGMASAGSEIAASTASAASRAFAVTTGVAGALAAHWLYSADVPSLH